MVNENGFRILVIQLYKILESVSLQSLYILHYNHKMKISNQNTNVLESILADVELKFKQRYFLSD